MISQGEIKRKYDKLIAMYAQRVSILLRLKMLMLA